MVLIGVDLPAAKRRARIRSGSSSRRPSRIQLTNAAIAQMISPQKTIVVKMPSPHPHHCAPEPQPPYQGER
jgi:hypothetical protein